MLDHLRCVCGHYKALHSANFDTECRICWRLPTQPCYRFRWRRTAWLRIV